MADDSDHDKDDRIGKMLDHDSDAFVLCDKLRVFMSNHILKGRTSIGVMNADIFDVIIRSLNHLDFTTFMSALVSPDGLSVLWVVFRVAINMKNIGVCRHIQGLLQKYRAPDLLEMYTRFVAYYAFDSTLSETYYAEFDPNLPVGYDFEPCAKVMIDTVLKRMISNDIVIYSVYVGKHTQSGHQTLHIPSKSDVRNTTNSVHQIIERIIESVFFQPNRPIKIPIEIETSIAMMASPLEVCLRFLTMSISNSVLTWLEFGVFFDEMERFDLFKAELCDTLKMISRVLDRMLDRHHHLVSHLDACQELRNNLEIEQAVKLYDFENLFSSINSICLDLALHFQDDQHLVDVVLDISRRHAIWNDSIIGGMIDKTTTDLKLQALFEDYEKECEAMTLFGGHA